jgi:ABC-type branched-subunit amino acid transport system permease subunit
LPPGASSLILQQAVRTIFGPNNREVGNPAWMSGSVELGQLTLTYNRLYIIAFAMAGLRRALFCQALHQLRLADARRVPEPGMAGSMGIRTKWVDALTFGLGSGIAGIAGVAISQIDNVSPNLGQAYIIDSFMVVVFGGVGNLWGTLVGALTLGVANKFLEPYRVPFWQDPRAGVHHPVYPEAAARPVRAEGPGGRSMITTMLLRAMGKWSYVFLAVLAVIAVLVPVMHLAVPAGHPLHVSGYAVALLGKYLTYALLAVGRSDLGLLRHSLARPRRVLRARRLCHGHVPDAPDRHARRLWPTRSCRTSWCS